MTKRIRRTRPTTLADIEALTDDELITVLDQLGVIVEQSSFVSRAKLAGSVRDLFEDELRALDATTRPTLLWCTVVLWDRWLPDLPCTERLLAWMGDVTREEPSTLASWRKAWATIQSRTPRDATTAVAVNKALDIDVTSWAPRAARVLDKAGAPADERLAFIDAWLAQLRDEDIRWRQGMLEHRVRCLAQLGRRDEAYALAREMNEKAPSSPSGHTALAALLLEDDKMDEAQEEMARAHDALEALASTPERTTTPSSNSSR